MLAIDPGPEQSALLEYEGGRVPFMMIRPNEEVRRYLLCGSRGEVVAIEMIASYGMAVGKEVFETCAWIGRFVEAFPGRHALVYRTDVKMHLCGTPRAKDANIRQALLDRFGGKPVAQGTKSNPGPLYGVKSHLWSALAVAVTYDETQRR